MAISQEITRLQNAKASLKTSINAKTDAQHQIANETIDDYADFVDSIIIGDDISNYFDIPLEIVPGNNPGKTNEICSKLKKLPNNIFTNGTSLSYSFAKCSMITTIPLFDTSSVTIMGYMFQNCTNLTTVPQLNTSSATNMASMFQNCTNLTTVPQLNTSSVANMSNMFSGCTNLTTIPQLNTSSATNMNSMFYGCTSLSDDSLNNILKMCIGTTSAYTQTKKLSSLGFNSSNYPASRIQALPSYQNFITAGWTIGY